jgi:hypothetical protein
VCSDTWDTWQSPTITLRRVDDESSIKPTIVPIGRLLRPGRKSPPMLRDERHQAIIEAVDVVYPMLDHIFVHRADEPPGSDRLADRLSWHGVANAAEPLEAARAIILRVGQALP